MGKRIKNKQKASKTKANSQNSFFGALIFGLVTCLVVWILLAVVCSLVLINNGDSTSLVGIVSPIIVAVSLIVGGFSAAKKDKADAFLISLLVGVIVLGVCYALSSIFHSQQSMGPVLKAITIVGMLVCPVIGAKFAMSSRGKTKRKH